MLKQLPRNRKCHFKSGPGKTKHCEKVAPPLKLKNKFADFNLSAGCFGIDIIPKWTKWSQMGVHGLRIGQIFAKIQCTSFWVRTDTRKHTQIQQLPQEKKKEEHKSTDI